MTRNTKPAMRRVASGLADSATPFLVFGLLALMGVIGYLQQKQGASPMVVWTDLGVRAALFFAVLAPLVLVGIFALSKIFNFKISSGAYMRSAAIAAVPIIGILGASLLPPNEVLKTLILICSIALAGALARGLFDLSLIEVLACIGICLPLFAAGMGITSKVATMARGGSEITIAQTPATAGGASPVRPAPTRAADPAQARLDALAKRVDEMGGDAMASMTRESFAERITSFQAELDALKASKGTTSLWQRISNQLRDLAPQGQSLPTEKPDESLFLAAAPTQNWSIVTLSSGGSDVAFNNLLIRLPAEARLDLKSSDPTSSTLKWTWPNSWSTLTLRTVTAPDARQKRPWVVNRAIMQRFAPVPKLYILQSEQPAMTMGNLADTVFFRVEGIGASSGDLLYTGLVDGKWLEALISGPAGSEARNAFEAAVKTLRKASAGEAPSDPFAPAQLVKRLEDDPETAAAMLKKHGPVAEDALLTALSGANKKVQLAVMDALVDIATAKSVDALKPLAESSDADLQKRAVLILKRLAPKEYDDLAMTSLTLRKGDEAQKLAALKVLAAAEKDPTRPQITREIESILLQEPPALREEAIKAMSVWGDSQTVGKLIPWLAQNSSLERRRAAITILPATKEPAAVIPMLNWVIQMPEEVTNAIIAMGPAAEDEVIKHLFTNLDNNRNVVARTAGTRMLGEIGTMKSLQVLQRASNDPRDATAASIAKIELEKVRARVLPNRGGPTTRRGT